MRFDSFTQLLSKRLTRKEFLLHLGLLLLALTGISALLNTLSNSNLTDKQQKTARRFGAGPYGG